jgi:hypothetical protein
MDSGLVFPLVVMGAVVSGAALWKLVLCPEARLRRAMRKVPVQPIAEVQDGQVAKIAGRLILDPAETPLEAPLTGRSCAYWEATVAEKRSSGKSSHWKTIISDRDFCNSFLVDDGTGCALVEVVWPKVVLTMDAHLRSGVLAEANDRCEAFLARHNESSEGWIFNRTLRYTEGALEAGEVVTVLGRCHWEPDPNPASGTATGYRERAMRLRIVSPDPEHLAFSDDQSCI